MSVFGALIAGVSGIRAQSQSLATISDNIANISTIGYKRVESRFSSLVTQSSPAVHSPGGVRAKPFQLIDQEGLLLGSSFETDLAIDGQGFFAVSDVALRGPGDEFFFTRAGSFRPDENGDLVNSAGFFLQSWQLDATGNLPTGSTQLTSLQTVNIANITGNPLPTSNVFLGATLNSQLTPGASVTSTMTIFDSLGTPQTLRLNWYKGSVPNEWFMAAQAGNPPDGINTVTGTTNTNTLGFTPPPIWADPVAGAGVEALKVRFNSDGSLRDILDWDDATTPTLSLTGTPPSLQLDIDFAGSGSSANQLVNLSVGTPGKTDGVNQFAVDTSNSLRTFTQDGLAFGTSTGVTIDELGNIAALFDNGEQKSLFRLPVVTFANPNGLEARTGNAYQQTSRSGDFVLKESSTGGAGKIVAFSLEGSTVDIADEFAQMIVTQRAYSANTRVISTADDMLNELIQIKR